MCLFCANVFAQNRPDWMDDDIRALQYPSSKFLVGFASGNLIEGEDVAHANERIKNAAQGNLLESVKVKIKSSTSSKISIGSANGHYFEDEQFVNQTSKNTVAEIVGMKTETYFDKKSKTVYVFAYANRNEVAEYHKKLLSYNLSQVESLLSTTKNLLAQKDKSSARVRCSEALSIFPKIDESHTLLIAVGGISVDDDVQQERTQNLYKAFVELRSQLDPKYEILENLCNELTQKIIQTESFLKTGKDLTDNGEKAKAKHQCEEAQTMMADVRRIQESIRNTLPSVSIETLMQQRTEALDNEIKLLSAQLAQAILVYIEYSEDLFGRQVSIISSKLKSQMASNGCSFTDEVSKADFKLTLSSVMRESSSTENFVFCYADVNIDLFDTHKQKSVYSDEISEKGGSTTKEKAARKAMENAASKIMESVAPWFK